MSTYYKSVRKVRVFSDSIFSLPGGFRMAGLVIGALALIARPALCFHGIELILSLSVAFEADKIFLSAADAADKLRMELHPLVGCGHKFLFSSLEESAVLAEGWGSFVYRWK